MEDWKGYTGGLPRRGNMQEMFYLKISVIVTGVCPLGENSLSSIFMIAFFCIYVLPQYKVDLQ